jgi:hypothetical protein
VEGSKGESLERKGTVDPNIQPCQYPWSRLFLFVVGLHGGIHELVCISTIDEDKSVFTPTQNLRHFNIFICIVAKDLHLSQNEIANSNIVALSATLLIRAISGPLCDSFGPRLIFVGCLVAGAIPTALAGTIHNATGLIILRFFIGILGASFVPCQVWTTAFFDKNVIGTANALTGGLGNSGGGFT